MRQIGEMDVGGRGLTITERLPVEVVVKHPDTGERLFVVGEGLVEPGGSLAWDYPADGLRIEMVVE